jgi:hypothetical protein
VGKQNKETNCCTSPSKYHKQKDSSFAMEWFSMEPYMCHSPNELFLVCKNRNNVSSRLYHSSPHPAQRRLWITTCQLISPLQCISLLFAIGQCNIAYKQNWKKTKFSAAASSKQTKTLLAPRKHMHVLLVKTMEHGTQNSLAFRVHWIFLFLSMSCTYVRLVTDKYILAAIIRLSLFQKDPLIYLQNKQTK